MTLALPIIDARGVRDPATCAACGGRCCDAQPGACWPEDFGHDLERIVAAIHGGSFAVRASRSGGPLWVRPATVEGRRRGAKLDRGSTGRCSLWDPATGCTLTFDERPAQCRWVTPIEYGKCNAGKEHQDGEAVAAWAALMPAIMQRVGTYEMPEGFDPAKEQAALDAGGCCGAPAE